MRLRSRTAPPPAQRHECEATRILDRIVGVMALAAASGQQHVLIAQVLSMIDPAGRSNSSPAPDPDLDPVTGCRSVAVTQGRD